MVILLLFLLFIVIASVFMIRLIVKSVMRSPMFKYYIHPRRLSRLINDPQQIDKLETDLRNSVNILGTITFTGKLAVGFGILQILIIPLYYFYQYLQIGVVSQELVYSIVPISIYQLITAAILIINGKKLRAVTMMNLTDSRKPLKWLSVLVGIIILFAIGDMVYTRSLSGGFGLLFVTLALYIVSSYSVLKIKPAPSDVTNNSDIPIDNSPKPPISFQ